MRHPDPNAAFGRLVCCADPRIYGRAKVANRTVQGQGIAGCRG